jgi:hypothetical protein
MSRQYKNVTRGFNFNTEIRLTGGWPQTQRMVDDLDQIIRLGVYRGKMSAAKKLKEIVKKHIRTSGGSLGWAPLKDSTKEWKARKGYDSSRILYASGTYYRSIKVWSKGSKVYVGVKNNTYNPYSKRTVGQIARMLEYGSIARSIPARPLWLPSFKEMGRNNKVKKLVLWHIRKEFRMRHGVTPRFSI